MSTKLSDAKIGLQQAVAAREADLRALSLRIHANPELGFAEHKAMAWLIEPLREAGFTVETGIAGMDTAFRAAWEGRPGGPTIALLAEYDALPGLGHGCGHNIICTAAVGAALALKDAVADLPGRILVLGTPAEENGGGKIIMCSHGVFDDVDAAMMIHPSRKTMVLRGGIACVDARFKFYGKASHAAAMPEKGISALDALLHTFNTINSLRQFFKDGTRIHGIITKGGEAANIVPDYCEAEFMVRSPNVRELMGVKEKVYAAARASAEAVGARCEIEEGLIYAERNNNLPLAHLFQENLEAMGVEVSAPPERGGIGSSDIGNVGQFTATIHPYLKICADDIPNHTPEFRDAAASEPGLKAVSLGASALAMTALDLCLNPEALVSVRDAFAEWKQRAMVEVASGTI